MGYVTALVVNNPVPQVPSEIVVSAIETERYLLSGLLLLVGSIFVAIGIVLAN